MLRCLTSIAEIILKTQTINMKVIFFLVGLHEVAVIYSESCSKEKCFEMIFILVKSDWCGSGVGEICMVKIYYL